MRNKPHVWNLDFSLFTFHFSLKFPTFAYQSGTYETFRSRLFSYKNVLASYTHIDSIKSPSLHSSYEEGEGRVSLHPVMLAGTGSDVGKSILATALCRIFLQDGYHPAPFKAQNMALNSFATPEGLEIGRAQAVQAEAAGIPCHTDMNPLLLKPQSDHTSQVVLNGMPIGNRDAYDFWRKDPLCPNRHLPHNGENHPDGLPPHYGGGSGRGSIDFRQEVCAAFDRLSQRFNPIVMEGAGSISEINLRDHDLVNMPMARYAHADVILVGDIDRGGVFASVYGSIALQTPEDRKHIKGIIINKFRGDLRLFDEGRKMLEELCGVPVLGVVPYYKDIHIEEEDSVALGRKAGGQLFTLNSPLSTVSVAVVLLRHLSNFTDFNVLERDPRVHLFYTNNTDDLLKSDIIIIPGSKSTLSDLYELRRNGVAQAIIRAHRQGATVMGICGGYQMMGVEVCDPMYVEGNIERLPGLGLLPTTTTMSGEKVTRQVMCEYGGGYEIHMGETHPIEGAAASPLLHLNDGTEDGYYMDDRCMGTYVHGILDNQSFIEKLLTPFKEKMQQKAQAFDYKTFKDEQYDKLADHVRQHVNIDLLYQILTNND